ncbi:MAG TPA: sialidase family protein [Myxococcales bacterium]|nr:sialidase family protein [Myxococcales bacterium]
MNNMVGRLALLLALLSCARPPPVLTGQVLSAGNEGGQDEDPGVLHAADGRLYVAWYSNRNGLQDDGTEDREIFLARSPDGESWPDPPIQVTRAARDSFTPSLAQDSAGTFHLAWWRVIPTSLGGTNNQILTKSSPDGTTWDLDQETVVAGGPGDFLPSIVHDRVASRLLVYFASPVRDAAGRVDLGAARTLRLYACVNDGTGWSAPQRLSGVNDDATHNTFPFVVQREDGQFLMVWTRYRASASADVLAVLSEASTETMTSTSSNGIDWAEPVPVSSGGGQSVDVFPSLYPDAARSSWTALWLTARQGAPSGDVVEVALDGALPAEPTARPEITGYSPRAAPLATPGRFLGVWVAGASGRQKIRFDFFSR